MYNRLTEDEKLQIAYLLSDYKTPFYYPDQMPKKSRLSYLILDFQQSKEVYSKQVDLITVYLNNSRGTRLDLIAS